MRKLKADQSHIIRNTIVQMKQSIELLELAARQDLPDEARDPIIGKATRLAIERLNVVRTEWGFDAIDVEDHEHEATLGGSAMTGRE